MQHQCKRQECGEIFSTRYELAYHYYVKHSLSYPDIATIMGYQKQSISPLITRGRRKMMEHLLDTGEFI